MNESQQGRVALVTGGARGLGVEVCRQVARAGMTVLLTARDEERAAAPGRACWTTMARPEVSFVTVAS